MNVFAASHAIDDGADHDDEIDEDAAHAHEALRVECMALVMSSPYCAPRKSGRPFRRAAGITVYLLPSPVKSQGGFPERLACSDGIRSGCALFPRAQSLAATRGRPGPRMPPRVGRTCGRQFRPDSGLLPFRPLPAMMPHHPTGDVHGIPKQRHAGT